MEEGIRVPAVVPVSAGGGVVASVVLVGGTVLMVVVAMVAAGCVVGGRESGVVDKEAAIGSVGSRLGVPSDTAGGSVGRESGPVVTWMV